MKDDLQELPEDVRQDAAVLVVQDLFGGVNADFGGEGDDAEVPGTGGAAVEDMEHAGVARGAVGGNGAVLERCAYGQVIPPVQVELSRRHGVAELVA